MKCNPTVNSKNILIEAEIRSQSVFPLISNPKTEAGSFILNHEDTRVCLLDFSTSAEQMFTNIIRYDSFGQLWNVPEIIKLFQFPDHSCNNLYCI